MIREVGLGWDQVKVDKVYSTFWILEKSGNMSSGAAASNERKIVITKKCYGCKEKLFPKENWVVVEIRLLSRNRE